MELNEEIEHDRLFKQLIGTFFHEFIMLFLPDISAFLDSEFEIIPMEQEILTDIVGGSVKIVDVLLKVKFRGSDAFFLIHVENQSSVSAEFPKRMFCYFSRLTEKFSLPVYPVVIFSHSSPLTAEPHIYEVEFPNKKVMTFDYDVIQLNQLPWRQYVGVKNPAACALMAKMKIPEADRPKVKLECLRMLLTLKLDEAKTRFIGVFVDTYLSLSPQEMEEFEGEVAKLPQTDKEETMALMSSWERAGFERGEERGMERGKEDLVSRLIRKRFQYDNLPTAIADRLERLSVAQLDELGEALFEFQGTADLEAWLARSN